MLKMLLSVVLTTSFFATSIVNAEDSKAETPVAPKRFQEAGYNFVGVSLGMAKPVGTHGRMPIRFAYGLEFTHALSKEFAVGVFGSRNDGETSVGSPFDLAITRAGLEAVYNPTRDSFIDLRAGITFLDLSAKIGNTTFTGSSDDHPFFVGTGVGYIYPLIDNLQLLPNIHYSYFFKDGGTQEFYVLDVMATVRYQF